MTNPNNTDSPESIVIDGRLQLLVSAMITFTTVGKWNELLAKLKDKPAGTEDRVTDTFEWTANALWKCGAERKLLPTKIVLSMELQGRTSNMAPNSGRGIEPFIHKFDTSDNLEKGGTFAPGEELVIEVRGGYEDGAVVSGIAKVTCAAVEET